MHNKNKYMISTLLISSLGLLAGCGSSSDDKETPPGQTQTPDDGYTDPQTLDDQALYLNEAFPAVSAKLLADSQAHPTGKAILQVDGLSFKDLNDNGQLDPYEDYRQSVNARAEDLLAQMSTAQKIGLMAVENSYMRADGGPCPTSTVVLNARDLVCETDFSLYGGLAVGVATSALIHDYNARYVVTRDASPAPETLARWSNQVQEIAEAAPLGIPLVITSNPREHASSGFGFAESSGNWPGTLGLAAAALGDQQQLGNLNLVGDFARLAAQKWVAGGIRKGYMYQADLATEPRWTRVNGTFGDDPDLIAAMQTQLIEGFQAPINVSSGEIRARVGVAMTTKHFPGNGIAPNGIDSHGHEGKDAIYSSPASLMLHLRPFEAAVRAGTSAIMTYYQAPSNAGATEQLPKAFWFTPQQQFETVGGGFNAQLLAYLRQGMGFNGIINTDSRIMLDEGEPFGVEHLTSVQREAKAINAGVNLVSVGTGEYRNGAFEAVAYQDIQTALDQGLISQDSIDDSARRLIKEMLRLGLFELRYVEPAYAAQIATIDQAQALQAQRKSIVLLKNDGVLPLQAVDASVAIYAEGFALGAAKASLTSNLRNRLRAEYPQAVFVDDYRQADLAFVMITPSNTTVCTTPDAQQVACAAPPSPLDAGLTRSHQEIGMNDFTIGQDELAVIHAIQAGAGKTVVIVNMGNPFLLDGVEPGAAAVLATYDVTFDALLDVINGDFNPSGRLPMSIPANQAAIRQNASDLPGHHEAFSYAYRDAMQHEYRFGFGLSYPN